MANPWLERRVLGYAHQGGALESPSSTLRAMRAALDAGAQAIELDVHCSADGELVVCHDAEVDRTTNGSGSLAEMTLEEIRSLDNAYWFVPGRGATSGLGPSEYPLRGLAPSDPELSIPTLREVLEAFPQVFINLDIKQTAPTVPPYEEALAALLAEYGREDDVIVASFHDAATERFAALAPEVSTSAGLAGVAAFFQAVRAGEDPPPTAHRALQVPTAAGGNTIVDEGFVAAAHAAGVAVHVWTIDDADEMARLVGLGVDGIMSDRPSVLARVLAETGTAWSARREEPA